VKIQGNRLEIYGFDAQWTALDRPRLPWVALRTQFNYADLVFVRTKTYGGDVVVSQKFDLLHAFAGAGYRRVEANVTNATSTLPLTANVDFNPKFDAGHFFAGTSVQAGPARVTAQADVTTRGINTYGTKISVNF
jgi:hypothetical protein